MTQLPVELYRQIINEPCVARKDLLNLCLASKALSAEAYRSLYRRIEIRRPTALKQALQTLNDLPELLGCVQTLIFAVPRTNSASWWFTDERFAPTLSTMKNLKELHISRTQNQSTLLGWDGELRIPQIETISLEYFGTLRVTTIFNELPSILPTLVTRNDINLDATDRITRLRIYACLLGASSTIQLRFLKVLELGDIRTIQLPRQIYNWVPNLDTCSYVGSLDDLEKYRHGAWSNILCTTRVKKIGPIFCQRSLEAEIANLSTSENLELVIFCVMGRAFRHSVPSIKNWLLTSPKLRKVVVLCDPRRDMNLYSWEKTRDKPSQGLCSSEAFSIKVSSPIKREDWEYTRCMLFRLPFIEFGRFP